MGPGTISPLTAGEADEAAAVLNSGLGDGYVSARTVASYIGTARHLALSYRTDRILGVLTGQLFPDTASLAASAPEDMAGRFEALLPPGPAGLIKSVAVSPPAQDRGAASMLVARAAGELAAMGAGFLVSVGWTDDDGCHIEGSLRRSGFTVRTDIAGFWYRDSIALGYTCPSCGPGCRCTARIFTCHVRRPGAGQQ